MNEARRPRVLVTRPAADAAALGERLAGLGFDAVLAPLMTIEPVDATLDVGGVQALLVTSANGARALIGHDGVPSDLPVLAVGDATAAAARAAGFSRVESAGGDVNDLARLAVARLDATAGALLHVAGTVQAGDLAGWLGGVGFEVRREVLYAARAADRLPSSAADAIAGGGLDGVLLYSPRTAGLFEALVGPAGLTEALAALDAFCLSANVEAALRARWRARHVAAAPDQDSLLTTLTACYH